MVRLMRSRYTTTRLGRGDVLGLPYLRCILSRYPPGLSAPCLLAGVLLVCRDIGCPSAVTTYTVRRTLNEYRINLYDALIFSNRADKLNYGERRQIICRAIVPRTLFTLFFGNWWFGISPTEDSPDIHVSQQGGDV